MPVNAPHSAAKATIVGSDCVRVGRCYRGGHGGAVLPAVHSADAGKMPETTKYNKPHQLFSPCWRRNDNRRQAFRAICRVCLPICRDCLPICRDCSRDLSGLFAGIVDSDENLLYFCLFIGLTYKNTSQEILERMESEVFQSLHASGARGMGGIGFWEPGVSITS